VTIDELKTVTDNRKLWRTLTKDSNNDDDDDNDGDNDDDCHHTNYCFRGAEDT